jgi:hypothetical protein
MGVLVTASNFIITDNGSITGNGYEGGTTKATIGRDFDLHMWSVTEDSSVNPPVIKWYLDGVEVADYTGVSGAEYIVRGCGYTTAAVLGNTDTGTYTADFQSVTEFDGTLLTGPDMLRLYNAGKI